MIKKYTKHITTFLIVIISITCLTYLTLNKESKAIKEPEKTTTKATKVVSKDTPGGKQLNEILSNGKPTVLYFTSQYCRDCQQVKPIIEKLQKKYSESVDFLIVDVRAKDSLSKAALRKYRILGIPITIFIKKDGTKVKTLASLNPKVKFKNYLKALPEKKREEKLLR